VLGKVDNCESCFWFQEEPDLEDRLDDEIKMLAQIGNKITELIKERR
jgi:hypothetical protein